MNSYYANAMQTHRQWARPVRKFEEMGINLDRVERLYRRYWLEPSHIVRSGGQFDEPNPNKGYQNMRFEKALEAVE
ncbi:MAG: hypothetical protein R3194_08670, partial [Limnobacter sp.]|nr:hypothetical protein [Limnobacter sp.]